VKRQRTNRLVVLLAVLGVIAVTGLLIDSLSERTRTVSPEAARLSWPAVEGEHGMPTQVQVGQQGEITARFQQAVMMLHAGQYDYAVTALHRVLKIEPLLPEAHVNMGYALLGKEQYAAARDFFMRAVELRREQVNAYWGLAVSLESLCDMEGARGAMRTYIHLTDSDDPFLSRARAALWEWESQSDPAGESGDGRSCNGTDRTL
jgi:Flp pilus assembly protein TadD